MIIYFIILFLIIILPNHTNRYVLIKNKKIFFKKIYFVFILCLLIMVAGLRAQSVGFDLNHHYVKNFYLYGNMPWSNISNFGIEIGIFVISKILNLFSLDVQWFIFVTSLISLVPILVFLYIESKDFKMSAILFLTYCLYYQHFNQIQQQIAVSMVLIGVLHLNKNHYIRYILFTLIASTFHSTAMLSFVLIIIKKIKLNWKTIIYLTLGIIISMYGFKTIFTYAIKFLPEYAWYSESLTHGVGDKGLGVYVQIILSFAVFFWSLIKVMSSNAKNEKYVFYTLCSYVYFISQLFTLNMIVMNRIGYYFLPFSLILCVENTQGINDKKNRFILKLGICFVMILYFSYITIVWADISYGIIPYELYK